ncbi:MAG TPA: ATP-binding cassette domain-containing protein [Solirubrobacteraceae bacterium]|nr:ATP-binding cassette domain-containing protein [Solirubrobacteraceae bacterium]
MRPPAVSLQEVFCLHRTPDGDVAALQGATLSVASGEQVGVLGPSGAGKTTLLRVIAGLQLPQAGRASVAGKDMGRLPTRRRAQLRRALIGFVAQDAAGVLPPDLRAGLAVEIPLALRGIARRERRLRAAELLDAVMLRDLAGAPAAELSGGERQRVALCVAIAHSPVLLLADEPTASLDGEAAQTVRIAIGQLAATYRFTAIVVTHDPATASALERTVRISDGRIAEERRGDEAALVVGRGGWVQLPETVLNRAGIGARLRVEPRDGELVLRPATDPGGGASPAHAPSARSASARHEPVTAELHEVFRHRALQGLTVAFAPGRLTVVAGASGVGKTTLLRLLCGLELPDAGAVRLGPWSLERLDPEACAALRRRTIGYLPQDPVPVGFLSAVENVALALTVRGRPPGEAAAQAAEALRAVGLGDRARQRTERMSAGEAQRVGLARALASARGLLLVDEPTSRLDRANARRVAACLVDAAHEAGQTVICATHDEDIIARADAMVTLGG